MKSQQPETYTQTETAPVSENPVSFWLRLDNAAKIYPAVQNEELTSVFRLSCVLKDRIRIGPLLKSIAQVENRFPYYKVKPKKGLFWYYLEFHDEPIPVMPDLAVPCRAFGKDGLIFRVLVKGCRLSVEFSHILTDGGGGFEFLKTLVLQYFQNCDIVIDENVQYLDPQDRPSAEEFEDGFSRYFQQDIPHPRKQPKSFHVPFPLKAPPRFEVLVARLLLREVSARAKTFGTTITEYLVSVYLMSLQTIYNNLSAAQRRKHRQILRVQVPVNLRRLYPSRTMRNFSLFVTPQIDLSLGQYTFEEITKTVHHFMQQETDKKLINKIIARNVGAERNVVLKNTPLFIKSLILYFTYSIAGTSRYTGVITNLGKVSFGKTDSLIDYFVFIPPPPNKALRVNCGVLGFGEWLMIAFGNITSSRELEKEFCRTLVKQGLKVRIVNY